MSGVWLQNGIITGRNVNSYKANCMLSNADSRSFNYETGINLPIKKDEIYTVKYFIDDYTWVLVNAANKRELFLDCEMSPNPFTGISSTPNLKTIKKITRNLLLIKN